MRHLIALFVLIGGLTLTANAQNDYDQAIGLRGGPANGITYKKALGEGTYLEAMASLRWGGFIVTGLYEITQNLDTQSPRFNWYYGFGGHVGFWSGYYNNNLWFDEDRNEFMVVGADGIIGIEYTFEEAPINISADWKPVINLIGADNFAGFNSGAISVRYVF